MEQKQIEEWKQQHGKVFECSADGETAYFRKPTRTELSYALALQANNKSIEMIEHILKSCYLGGSRVFLEDTDYMLGAADLVNSLVQVKHVEVKNL